MPIASCKHEMHAALVLSGNRQTPLTYYPHDCAGLQSYDRYELYKPARTLNEMLALGGKTADIPFDYTRGYFTVSGAESVKRSSSSLSSHSDAPPKAKKVNALKKVKTHRPAYETETAASEPDEQPVRKKIKQKQVPTEFKPDPVPSSNHGRLIPKKRDRSNDPFKSGGGPKAPRSQMPNIVAAPDPFSAFEVTDEDKDAIHRDQEVVAEDRTDVPLSEAFVKLDRAFALYEQNR